MGRRRKDFDHDMVVKLYKNGESTKEISGKMGCGVSTVRRILRASGAFDEPKPSRIEQKTPIYLEELEQLKNQIQIGDTLWLEEGDTKDRCPDGGRYTVTAKYRHFLVAEKGKKERHVLYVDLIIEGRRKTA